VTTWTWSWRVGQEVVRSPSFSSRADAEAWMGSEWEALLAAGALSATLEEDGRAAYEMGLGAP
jgi:hypothetical protein